MLKKIIKLLQNEKIQILIIVFFVSFAYSNIFLNEFATDDIGYFYNWDIPKSFKNLPMIFTRNSVPLDEQGVYRPVKALLIMLSYKLWRFDLVGYHLFSLFIHLSSTVLIYFITRVLIETKMDNVKKRKKSIINHLPFLTALLFGLHPIHTEAVTFILASYDSAGLMFYLLAFWLYLRKKTLLSLMFTFIAFFTYEMTLTLPIIIFLYDFIFKKKSKSIPFFLVLIFYTFVRVILLRIPPRGEYLGGDFYLTMLVMTKAFVLYLQLLLWPINLSLDHQIAPGIYSVISKPYTDLKTLHSLSILNSDILINLLIIILLIFFIFKFYKKLPLIAFLISWFFITLLPVSDIFPQGSIFAERYVYLASFAFCFLIALLFNYLFFEKCRRSIKFFKYACVFVLFSILIVYGLGTYKRNFDWKDTLNVWQKLADQNPRYIIANLTLAKIYKEKDQNTQAIFYFNKALDLDPNLEEARLSAKFFQNEDFSFYYPLGWNLEKEQIGIKIVNNGYKIQIKADNLGNTSIEDYLNKQKALGLLNSQGLVKLPNFETGYAKIWSIKEAMIYQFFLFKGSSVVEVVVNSMDSKLKDSFDAILESIKLRAGIG